MALEDVLIRPNRSRPELNRSEFSPPAFFRKEYFVCKKKRNEYEIQNIPEFQSFSYLRQSVPYRDGCEITLLQNWICVLGGNTFWFFMTQKCPTFSILDLNDNEKFNGPPMTHDRSNFSVVSTKYRIYVFGGRSNANLIGYCEMFDIRNSRWSDINPLSRSCCETSAVVIPERGILLVGDEKLEFGKSAQLLEGDVENGKPERLKWRSVPPMRSSRKRPGIACFDGFVYVAGGNLAENSDVEKLSVSECNFRLQWTIVSLLKSPLHQPCNLFVFDGELCILHGNGVVLEYSPDKLPNGDSWKELKILSDFADSIILQREAQYTYPRWSTEV
ncbi:unnamed protein product [Hymenolepis diminuta]|uniref:Uncharacterized protein n=2 Tax=Hymenolepis diminuta TaxID=6216 RepID=A0A564YWG0_HYMDI|nr:unnamed protein product [Hymenolepis diminuta]VUZ51530.1 unnamed protein product [Hymenolepis diminuta]